MSMLRAMSNDGHFKVVDDMMIFVLQKLFPDRVYFPWEESYQSKIHSREEYNDCNPSFIIECMNQEDRNNAVEFATNNNFRYFLDEKVFHTSSNHSLDDCIIIETGK